MSPINVRCEGCGRTVQAPESTAGQNVKCPTCGKGLVVPEGGPTGEGDAGELELTCRDCGKVFRVPLARRGEVVSCPSCGSWVPAGQKRRSILQQDLPMPFQVPSSILKWLRFFAGFNLIIGLGAAIWVGLVYGTKPLPPDGSREMSGTIELKESGRDEGGFVGEFDGLSTAPAASGREGARVVNPVGIAVTFGLVIVAILGSVILMAFYWIMETLRTLARAPDDIPPPES